MEEDEAGRLAAFRSRFGRTYDATARKLEQGSEQQITEIDSAQPGKQAETLTEAKDSKAESADDYTETGFEFDDFDEEDESLLDLISGYGQGEAGQKDGTPMAKKEKKKR